MLKPTKQHIQDHALKLFNQKGFVNVRLQHIADAAFVSVGHLAYHFKNKDSIVESLYDELRGKQEQLLNEYRVVPLFEDINSYFASNYEIQCIYMFFYVDTLEILRAYPEIQKKHFLNVQWQLTQLKTMIGFNCARGAFNKLADEQQTFLAWQLRSLIDMWPYLKKVQGVSQIGQLLFLSDMWAVLTPFFTDMGNKEYQQLNSIE